MKLNKIKIIRFLIIILFLINCSSQKNEFDFELSNVSNKIEMRKYKLIQIDSLKYNYIFFVSRNDSIYKLFSERKKTKEDCKELLIVNNTYDLELFSSYSNLVRINFNIQGILGFKAEPINYQNDSTIIRDIFRSPNIKGKCYIKP